MSVHGFPVWSSAGCPARKQAQRGKDRGMRTCIINLKARLLGIFLAALLLAGHSGTACADEEGSLGYRLAQKLQAKGISQELAVLVISALPIVELRGAIPAAHLMGMNPLNAYLLAVLGNMIPVIPIILLLGPITRWLTKYPFGERFFNWFFKRTKSRAGVVERYETVGLALFVAIPLPVTGAWTGCAAAFLFEIKPFHAFFAILGGVLISGLIMTIISSLGWIGLVIAVVVLGGLLAKVVYNIVRLKKQIDNE